MNNLTDRVLSVLQTRFPLEFEIALLTAQNESLRQDLQEALDELEEEEPDGPSSAA